VIGNWYHRAACRLIDPDTMHPMTNERGIGKAKGVCARCEVIRECLAYALDHDERHGIWGGLTEDERSDLRRNTRTGS
jgi:WhiB family redox-sensing transcriptional regulator